MRGNGKGNKKIKILLFVFFLILLLALLFSLRIKTVAVSGNVRYTEEQIENTIFESQIEKNAAYCYFQYKFRPHKQIPFVEDYKIVFRSPTKVEVIVYEKSVVGYVSYMNSQMYFDKDGIIVESTNDKLPGIPLITGLKFGHIVLHKPLPIENSRVFEEILNLTQLLSLFQISADEIHYNAEAEADLIIGALKVELGDNSNMNGKISELNDILKSYAELDGTLYLDAYDENNSNPSYRFEKK